jgi:hypothetical protein
MLFGLKRAVISSTSTVISATTAGTSPAILETVEKNQKFVHIPLLLVAIQFRLEECPLHQLCPEIVLLACDPPLKLPLRLVSFFHQDLAFERSFVHERPAVNPLGGITRVFRFEGNGQDTGILRGEGGTGDGFGGRCTWSILVKRHHRSFERRWLKS